MVSVIIFLLLIGNVSIGFAQDTISFMHYNLLNYRNTTNQCTNSTNNPDTKEGHLETIVSHVKPDILTINEMGANWLNPNKLLTNSLNKNGVSHFDQAEYANNSFSGLTNMLFFNSNKLELYNQVALDKDVNNAEMVRVIDVYTLFVKNGALLTGDTTFLTVFVAHLKAGSTSADKDKRQEMAKAAMEYLKNNHKSHSYFFAGDFNIQTHSEACYQTITKNSATTIRFYDPKDAPGSWNNKSTYSNLHTQSTHDGDSRGGCFSTGGMDDRFDFILCGKEVIEGTYGVQYLDGTYTALGQDSRRFNGNIKYPASNIIPASVQNALYEMSDHLPVLMDVSVKDNSVSVNKIATKSKIVISHLNDGDLKVHLPVGHTYPELRVMEMGGKIVRQKVNLEGTKWHIATAGLPSGLYLVNAITSTGEVYTQKVGILGN